MTRKVKDLAVKVGTYVNNYGQEKGRYENVGAVMDGDNGQFIMLKRTFNPAGCPNPQGRDSVLVSVFDPKPRDGASDQTSTQAQTDAGGAASGLDDDISF